MKDRFGISSSPKVAFPPSLESCDRTSLGGRVLMKDPSNGSEVNATLFRKSMVQHDFRTVDGVEMAYGSVSVLR